MRAKKFRVGPVNRSNKRKQAEKDLPAIPDKRYFTISEVGTLCAVKAYVALLGAGIYSAETGEGRGTDVTINIRMYCWSAK